MNHVSCVTSGIAAAPIRFQNVILTSFCYVITIYARCARERGKMDTASVAENRTASDAKEAIYEEVRM